MLNKLLCAALAVLAAGMATAHAAPTEPAAAQPAAQREAFQGRLATVNALGDALARLGAREAAAKVSGMAQEAARLQETGRTEAARTLLDEAYQFARSSIDTSVRARPEEKIELRTPEKASNFEARLTSVNALTDALERLGDRTTASRAGSLAKEAQRLKAAGDGERADATLQEAYGIAKTAIDASVRARPASERGAVTTSSEPDRAFKTQKQQRDYQARAESTQTLREALARIAAEKGAQERYAPVLAHIDSRLAAAREKSAAGDQERARALADEAYRNAQISIEALRRGDVLVRALNFKDKKEEYAYELDRNDAHLMLVRLLVDDSNDDPRAREFVAKAQALRREAEALARREDHAAAVGRLEEATRELQKAIRNAGVMIPG